MTTSISRVRFRLRTGDNLRWGRRRYGKQITTVRVASYNLWNELSIFKIQLPWVLESTIVSIRKSCSCDKRFCNFRDSRAIHKLEPP